MEEIWRLIIASSLTGIVSMISIYITNRHNMKITEKNHDLELKKKKMDYEAELEKIRYEIKYKLNLKRMEEIYLPILEIYEKCNAVRYYGPDSYGKGLNDYYANQVKEIYKKNLKMLTYDLIKEFSLAETTEYEDLGYTETHVIQEINLFLYDDSRKLYNKIKQEAEKIEEEYNI